MSKQVVYVLEEHRGGEWIAGGCSVERDEMMVEMGRYALENQLGGDECRLRVMPYSPLRDKGLREAEA